VVPPIVTTGEVTLAEETLNMRQELDLGAIAGRIHGVGQL
jgi:hypothetical protein